jgi:peptide chain release factor subunit 1
MSTDIRKTLKELAKMQPGGGDVISVYVNASPDGKGRRNYDVFLKKKFSEIEKGLPPRSPEAQAFPVAVRKVGRYLADDLRPESRGAAVFVSPARNLFQTFQTALPLANRVVVSRVPFIYPLVRLSDDYGRYGVLISDEQRARLFSIYLGRIEEEAEIVTQAESVSAKGYETRKGRLGLSDEKHHRHLKDLRAKHVKSVVREVQKFLPPDTQQVLLAAENGTLAELKKQLPAALAKKTVHTARFDLRSPAKKVLEESLKIFQQLENGQSRQIAREAVVLTKSRGSRAMLGTKAVLAAMQDGRAETLVVSEKYAGEGWQCLECMKLGAVGKPRECPYCGGKEIDRRPDMKEEMVCLALRHGFKVEFVEGEPELDANGGIGALMRGR